MSFRSLDTVHQHDDQKVKDYGIDLAIKMIRRLTKDGVSGFHFCTLNLEKSVRRVLEGLGWIGENQRTIEQNRLIVVLKYLFFFYRYTTYKFLGNTIPNLCGNRRFRSDHYPA